LLNIFLVNVKQRLSTIVDGSCLPYWKNWGITCVVESGHPEYYASDGAWHPNVAYLSILCFCTYCSCHSSKSFLVSFLLTVLSY